MSLKSSWKKLKNSVSNTFNDWKGTIVGGLVGGPIGMHYGSQYDMMRMQNEMQNAQIERQNELNMQMWNLQNEYNSPYNQMQRYKNAGLNPNLIYGSVSSGNASSAPEMSATVGGSNALALASVINQASGDASKLLKGVASKMLNNYLDGLDLDLAQKSANVSNTKAQTKALSSVKNQTTGNTGRFGQAYNLGKQIANDIKEKRIENIENNENYGASWKQKKITFDMEAKYRLGEISKKQYEGFLWRELNNSISEKEKDFYWNMIKEL